VKTKGGMRFVTPSKKSVAGNTSSSGRVSVRPAASVQPQPTVKHTASTSAAAAAAAAAAATTVARGNKQTAAIAPTSQLAKVMMMLSVGHTVMCVCEHLHIYSDVICVNLCFGMS